MIYVTADLHGDVDRLKNLPCRLGRRDTLIVLGDFGFLWSGSKAERRQLAWLGRRPYTLLFLDGAHENYDMLREYPICEFAGGKAQQISGKLYHLMRGEIYTIEEKTLLCFGGGESSDKDTRTEGVSWWRSELPDAAQLDNCTANLAAHLGAVDYILTHEAPEKTFRFLRLNDSAVVETNRLEAFLEELCTSVTYTHWYFGCYHRDQGVGPRMTAVYKKVLPLYPAPAKKKLFGK